MHSFSGYDKIKLVKIRVVLIASLLLFVLCTQVVFAQNLVVSGKTSDNISSPVSGTKIIFTDSTTHAIIATVVTGFEGTYQLEVPSGVYDITYTPPQGSNLKSTTVINQKISSSTQNNFTFQSVKNKKSKGYTNVFVIVCILLVFGIVGTIVFFIYLKYKKDKTRVK